MSLNYCYIAAMLISSVTMIYGKRTYSFEARVASKGIFNVDTGSPDQLYFRLCSNTLCSTFIDVIWNQEGKLYTYNVITPTDYGTINKIQIVHTGNDMVCLDYIKVDGVEYDKGEVPYCWEADNTCNTLTVTSSNNWSEYESNPCEYISEFDVTYNPTKEPTKSSNAPSNVPTNSPSNSPSDAPTDSPSASTINPTAMPTVSPIIASTSYNFESKDENHTIKHDGINLVMIIIILSIALVGMILIICCIAFCFVYQRGIKKGMETNKGDQAAMSDDDNKNAPKAGEQTVLNMEDDEKEIKDKEQDEGHKETGYKMETEVVMNKKEDIYINNNNNSNNNEERDDMDELYVSNDNAGSSSLIPGSPVAHKRDNTPDISEIGAMEMEKKVLKKVDSLDDLYEPTEDNTPGYIQNNEEMAMENK